MGATRLRAGDLLRFNPHFHALILEGGFDAAGRFIFIPLGDLARMTQYLRRRVLKLFLNKRLISRTGIFLTVVAGPLIALAKAVRQLLPTGDDERCCCQVSYSREQTTRVR